MNNKYIITLADEYAVGRKLTMPVTINSRNTAWVRTDIDLTPYTEPDTEQVRKEAHEAYQRGLSDAWEAARRIAKLNTDEQERLFGCFGIYFIAHEFSAYEAIEKIRQYEQEKDRQARIEYNFDEVKDVIETTANEYNMSLDEIAEVLRKMREES